MNLMGRRSFESLLGLVLKWDGDYWKDRSATGKAVGWINTVHLDELISELEIARVVDKVLLFAATILAARKPNGNRKQAMPHAGVRHSISNAELIFRRTDERWPADMRSSKRRSGNPQGVSSDSRGGRHLGSGGVH